MITTRDATLPAAYSQTLESLSLGPLWTALHQLLPHERTTRAVPHVWSWRAVRPLAARCALGLGLLYRAAHRRLPARRELTAAADACRTLGMKVYADRAEAALADL